jgi:hypothetical protein
MAGEKHPFVIDAVTGSKLTVTNIILDEFGLHPGQAVDPVTIFMLMGSCLATYRVSVDLDKVQEGWTIGEDGVVKR